MKYLIIFLGLNLVLSVCFAQSPQLSGYHKNLTDPEFSISNDSRLLATYSGTSYQGQTTGEIIIWSLDLGKQLRQFNVTNPSSLIFSPDNKFLVFRSVSGVGDLRDQSHLNVYSISDSKTIVDIPLGRELDKKELKIKFNSTGEQLYIFNLSDSSFSYNVRNGWKKEFIGRGIYLFLKDKILNIFCDQKSTIVSYYTLTNELVDTFRFTKIFDIGGIERLDENQINILLNNYTRGEYSEITEDSLIHIDTKTKEFNLFRLKRYTFSYTTGSEIERSESIATLESNENYIGTYWQGQVWPDSHPLSRIGSETSIISYDESIIRYIEPSSITISIQRRPGNPYLDTKGFKKFSKEFAKLGYKVSFSESDNITATCQADKFDRIRLLKLCSSFGIYGDGFYPALKIHYNFQNSKLIELDRETGNTNTLNGIKSDFFSRDLARDEDFKHYYSKSGNCMRFIDHISDTLEIMSAEDNSIIKIEQKYFWDIKSLGNDCFAISLPGESFEIYDLDKNKYLLQSSPITENISRFQIDGEFMVISQGERINSLNLKTLAKRQGNQSDKNINEIKYDFKNAKFIVLSVNDTLFKIPFKYNSNYRESFGAENWMGEKNRDWSYNKHSKIFAIKFNNSIYVFNLLSGRLENQFNIFGGYPMLDINDNGDIVIASSESVYYIKKNGYKVEGRYERTSMVMSKENSNSYSMDQSYYPTFLQYLNAKNLITCRINLSHGDINPNPIIEHFEINAEKIILKRNYEGILLDVHKENGLILIKHDLHDSVFVFDINSGKEIASKLLNFRLIKFTPDGKHLVMATSANSIRIISITNNDIDLSLYPLLDNDWVVTHPSGLFDATNGAMNQLYFVQGLDVIDFNQLKERYYEPGLWKKVMTGEELRSVFGMKSIDLPPDIQVGKVDGEGYLNINLTNRGGGIGEVNVFVNGKEIIKDARDNNIKADAPTATIKLFVGKHKSIVKGQENFIGVKAWNKDHWVQSRGALVSYESKEIESYKPAVHILTCGVSDYTGTEIDLKYAAKDANDVSQALQLGAKKLFGTERSYVYNFTTTQAKEYYPTKTNILKTFEKISTTAHPLDVFVMYVSGHGINYGGQDGDWHYLTQEAYTGSAQAYSDPAIRQQTTISSNELVEMFKKVPALKQVLIIDACASGKVVDNLMNQKDIASSTLRALDRMRDRTGMHIITGCTADAVSYEASKYGQGVLTYSILEGIRGAALREEQYVDVNKLFQYAQERVPELAEGIGGIQSPQVFSPQGSQSFDIGLLGDTEKKEIPIAKIKPVYIRSNFQDENELEDVLGLGKLMDASLNEVASKGAESSLIFVDVREYPEGCKLIGRYKKENGKIIIKLRRKCGAEDKTFEITGTDAGDVSAKIIKLL